LYSGRTKKLLDPKVDKLRKGSLYLYVILLTFVVFVIGLFIILSYAKYGSVKEIAEKEGIYGFLIFMLFIIIFAYGSLSCYYVRKHRHLVIYKEGILLPTTWIGAAVGGPGYGAVIPPRVFQSEKKRFLPAYSIIKVGLFLYPLSLSRGLLPDKTILGVRKIEIMYLSNVRSHEKYKIKKWLIEGRDVFHYLPEYPKYDAFVSALSNMNWKPEIFVFTGKLQRDSIEFEKRCKAGSKELGYKRIITLLPEYLDTLSKRRPRVSIV